MGTPSSQSELTRADVIRALGIKGEKLSFAMMAADGLDVEILEIVYEKLKLKLERWRGYRELDQDFQGYNYHNRSSSPAMPLWLKEAGMADRFNQVIPVAEWGIADAKGEYFQPIPVADIGKYDENGSSRLCLLRLYLTRKGEWIAWASYPTSVFRVTGTPAEAMESVLSMVPPTMQLRYRGYDTWRGSSIVYEIRNKDRQVSSLALEVCSTLLERFSGSIAKKRQDVDEDDRMSKSLEALMSRFEH